LGSIKLKKCKKSKIEQWGYLYERDVRYSAQRWMTPNGDVHMRDTATLPHNKECLSPEGHTFLVWIHAPHKNKIMAMK
jgi:hypothetical protein